MNYNHKCRLVPRFMLPRWDRPERIEAIIDFCEKINADEMMLFPVGQHLPPVPQNNEQTLRKRAREIARIRELAAKHGIEVIINHYGYLDDWGASLGTTLMRDWDWSVDLSGKPAVGYGCLLSEKVRTDAANELIALAESGVKKIFQDDDVRYDWHPAHTRLDGMHFCFCPLHIRAFSEKLGWEISRDELIRAVQSNAPADKAIRHEWLAFKRETFMDFVDYCREQVHKKFPQVRLGLMTTFVHLAAWCGTTFAEHVNTWAGPLRPLCRPAQGWYGDHDKNGVLMAVAQTMWTAHCLTDDTEIYSEVDWGCPWTQLQNSSRMSADFQIKVNLLLNIKTHSLLYLGEGPEDRFLQERLIRRLSSNRAVFDSLAQQLPQQARPIGLQFLMCEKLGKTHPIQSRGREGNLADPFALTGEGLGLAPWSRAFKTLARTGIAMTFDESHVGVLTGGVAIAMESRLEQILNRKSLIIDAGAAVDLDKLGLLKKFGLRLGEDYKYERGERLTRDPLNKSAENEIIPVARLMPPERVVEFIAVADSDVEHRLISEIIGMDLTVRGAGIVLVDKLPNGRRACLLPFNLSDEKAWGFGIRKQQWRGILDWLSEGQNSWPVWVDDAYDVWPIVYRVEVNDRCWVGMINCGHDPADDVSFHLALEGLHRIQYLDDKGKLCPLDPRYIHQQEKQLTIELCDKHAVKPFDVRLFIIEPA